MMIQYAERAARLNNEAVSLLIAGKDEMAIASFAQSIALMKRLLVKAQQAQAVASSSRACAASSQVGASSSTTHEGFPSMMRSRPISPPVDLESVTIHTASSPLTNLTDRQYYIYNHALSISMDHPGDVPVENYAHVYCAIVIFNLALANHRRGLVQGGNKKCKERAMVLYNMILRLLRQSNAEGSAVFVKMATLNNLSQLRFEQGHYAQAREGLDYLSELLMQRNTVVSSSSETGKSSSLLKASGELKGLIMNVLFVKSPQVASAA